MYNLSTTNPWPPPVIVAVATPLVPTSNLPEGINVNAPVKVFKEDTPPPPPAGTAQVLSPLKKLVASGVPVAERVPVNVAAPDWVLVGVKSIKDPLVAVKEAIPVTLDASIFIVLPVLVNVTLFPASNLTISVVPVEGINWISASVPFWTEAKSYVVLLPAAPLVADVILP